MAKEKAPERCPHRWCLFCGLYEVGTDVGDGLTGLIPGEFRQETLLAFRSILDRWIAGAEEKAGTRRRPQKVKVE